jgi:hypothetical protein
VPLFFQIVYSLVPKIEFCLKYFLDKIFQKQSLCQGRRPKCRLEGSSRQDRAVAVAAASGQAGGNLEGLSRQLGSCCQLQAAVMAAALPSNATCARHEGHIRPHTQKTEACSRLASHTRAAYCRRRCRRSSSSSLLAPVPRKLFSPAFRAF